MARVLYAHQFLCYRYTSLFVCTVPFFSIKMHKGWIGEENVIDTAL